MAPPKPTGRVPGPAGKDLKPFFPAPAGRFNLPDLPPPPLAPTQPPKPKSEPFTNTPKPSEMLLSFDPTKSRRVGRCGQIKFVQTCQIIADSKPIQPGLFFAGFKFRDAFALGDGTYIDTFEENLTPFYDVVSSIGFFRESPEGSGQIVAGEAGMGDAPIAKNKTIMFNPATNPKGFRDVTMKLEIFATCAAGKDTGKFYEGVRWEWHLTAQENTAGSNGTVRIIEKDVDVPSQAFFDALGKYTTVRGGG